MAVAYGRVTHDQRHTRYSPCEVCKGYDDRRLGDDRCYGYRSGDDRYEFCTNPAYAGNLTQRADGSYQHKMDGPCWCEDDHASTFRLDPLPKRAPATPAKISRTHQHHPTIATHEYRDAHGVPRFRVARFWSGKEPPPGLENVPKCMPQRPDGAGDWIDGLDGKPYAGLYRLPELLAADPRRPVFIPEGEKCADALAALGAVVTCNAGGASKGKGKWREEYNARFRDRHVVILADADENGRAHAQGILENLTSVAKSVRLLELEGVPDVADWLANGHTLLELLEIIACLPSAQNSNPGMSSSTGGTTAQKCPNCQQVEERAKMAETSLANLRREQAMTSRILALPKEQLSPPLKPAAIAVREVLSQPRARDEQGMEMVYRRAISQRCGVSDETAGTYLRKLAEAGVIHRQVRKSFDTTEIHISEGPLFDAPEQIEPTPITWGGKRTKKGCPNCGGINIEPYVYHCTDCGHNSMVNELIDVVVQEEAQDTSPPPDPIVRHLAPDAVDDAPHCPDCGRAGDDLQDYGPVYGLRCTVCDVAAVG